MDINRIRFIGRHINKNGKEYFSFSGCGFEFAINSTSKKVSITLDLLSELNECDSQYIAIYVNEVFRSKERLIKGENRIKMSLDNLTSRTIIRIIKVNEVYLSSIYLSDITLFNAELIDLEPSNKKKIGFFGDSLTCGYGLDDYHGLEFKMEGEDFTKTYAYLASFGLNMDYSIVARSGISISLKIYIDQLFNEIYETVDMVNQCEVEKDLDYAVINLGTNDNTAYLSIKENNKKKAYKELLDQYLLLVKRIVKNNPSVKLVLCYKMVPIEEVIEKALKEIKKYVDNNLHVQCKLLKFNPNIDGACSHPYWTAHLEASKLLINAIKEFDK